MTALRETPSAGVSNPFKFLDYYDEEDQAKFSGRHRDVREVLARVTTQRTSVLYARSGLGKTSLLLAGVFPALRERGYRPIYVRTLSSPLADLATVVERECGGGDGDLAGSLRRASGEQPIVLALDQFEEFFIRFEAGSPERSEFIAALGELISDASLNLRVVISLREDYLANLGDFRQELPRLFTAEYRLQPLTAFGARQAISQPLTAAGIAYDPRLVGRLVDLLADEDFDPVLLQIICTEVFQEARRAGRERLALKREDLENIEGGLDEVLRRHLDRAIKDLPAGLHLVARAVLDALITLEKTKRAVTREYFKGSDLVATEEELDQVLLFLDRKRLVRAEARNGEEWYELKHDRLVDTVLGWVDGDPHFFDYREARNQILNLSRQSRRWRENPEILLSRGVIENIIGKSDFRDRLALDAVQLEMTVRSCVYRQDEHLDAEHLWHWCGLLRKERGDPALVDVLVDALESDSPKMRAGAALATCTLELEDPRLAGKLLRRTLEDERSEVRRAAGAAWARVAGDEQLEALGAELGSSDRQRRERARETLADFEGGRKKFGHIGRLDRWRARRIYAQRQRARHQVAIVARGRLGALSGLLGGLIWSMTFGVGFSVASTWAIGPEVWSWGSEPGSWYQGAALFSSLTLVLLPFSTLVGWRVSIKAAEIAAVCGEEKWSWAVRKSFAVYGVIFVPTLLMILLYLLVTLEGLSGYPISILGGLAFGVGVGFLISAIVFVVQGCAGPGRARWFWLMASTWSLPLGFSAILRVGMYPMALAGLDQEALEVPIVFVGLAEILSCWLAFIVGYSLLRTQRAEPLPGASETVPSRRRIASRAFVLTVIPTLLFWLYNIYGFDAVPFPLPIVNPPVLVKQGTTPLALDMGPELSTAYARLRFHSDSPQVLSVSSSPREKVGIDGVRSTRAFVFDEIDLAVNSTDFENRATMLNLKLEDAQIIELEGKRTGQDNRTVVPSAQDFLWRWTAPEDGLVFFDTKESELKIVLTVRKEGGDSVAAYTYVDGGSARRLLGGLDANRSSFEATKGQTYYLEAGYPDLETFGSEAATINLSWSYDQAPSSSETSKQATSEALPELQEEIPPSQNYGFDRARELLGRTGKEVANNALVDHDDSASVFLGKSSLWWTWTAPAAGIAVFQTGGSSIDTLLGAYRWTGGAWEIVAENDDDAGALQSRVHFITEQGVTYHVAVGGYKNQTGFIRLRWTWKSLEESSPDTFDSPLAFERREILASNAQATAEPGEPAHAGRPARSSLWWTWTPSEDDMVGLRIEAQGFSPVVAVYVGDDLTDLRTVASHDSGDSDVANTGFEAHEGQAYRIVVDSRDNRSGTFVLSRTPKIRKR